MNWKKVTIGLLIAITIIIIGYDIFIVLTDDKATISRIMHNALWKFPFIIYAWLGLGGHFMSLKKMKKQYIKLLAIISSIVFAFSFFPMVGVFKMSGWSLYLIGCLGFLTGTFTWSLRIEDKE